MITPDEDGSFFAEIVEFPGCFASGKTAAEALETLESVAVDWINAAVKQGQNIPEPMDVNEYSGKFVQRMPKSLHKRAALWADREGVSLNQFIVFCVAEAIGTRARPAVNTSALTNLNLQIVGGGGGWVQALATVTSRSPMHAVFAGCVQRIVPPAHGGPK